MLYTHPQALVCLQGFTFLALDMKAGRWPGIQLLDILAPGEELIQMQENMPPIPAEDDFIALLRRDPAVEEEL
ncbi:uncharacterized protein BXZ73DRAFT_104722 [Epithele typhae]|uniref:uncharacterized protein n=1 Tax=Epithele typhae TaxID=378194 RepID=UPI002007C538|nr:uncharacterized protein BXZ73DRAFT_104722 [Epithele typhae]KAH9920210.1 hypothetical protein BXZ73DRAFT_104722 [Epithele typhae]